jgi:hypothetical protein
MSRLPTHRAGSLVALAAVAVAVALAMAACGDDSSSTSTAAESGGSTTAGMDVGAAPSAPSDSDGAVSTVVDPSDQATTIPELPDNEDPSAVQCTGEPKQVFDATATIGESLSAASDAASAAGCEIREVVKDGEQLAATQDFRPDRVNVATENGQVTKIVSIG